ncbi:cobyrinic acid a,c-diamide synthase [Bacillus sp. FJAT-27264]|uniref:MinD/ParA family protein n=1 Tax=Paenibacillus sp. (strain DSM 101736 / FJAT-27264) TaxID=1850362 RepID=UPI000807E2CF|nr:MinD/ParA family protein [Bacillus sp. FJAT-27264]OBZ18366.1 cobyrinic acid a,c-diamide synthase [Bacillus sp. FJAT-27264]
MDQAQSLRYLVSSQDTKRITKEGSTARVITVCSGKGGVGKSNFTLNFALALQSLGKKVLLFDADIGMANIDVLMGVSPRYNLYHLLTREVDISRVVQLGPQDLPFIAGGSGMDELFSLSEADLNYFTTQIAEIADSMDYILFDTGAGLSKETMKFISSADDCLVVTTPEPTAITDAYALMKVVHNSHPDVSFRLIVNQAGDLREAAATSDKIRMAASRFLQLNLPFLGHISSDSHVVQAVKRQVPFILAYPNSAAAKDVHLLAVRYLASDAAIETKVQGIKGFIRKWLIRNR